MNKITLIIKTLLEKLSLMMTIKKINHKTLSLTLKNNKDNFLCIIISHIISNRHI